GGLRKPSLLQLRPEIAPIRAVHAGRSGEVHQPDRAARELRGDREVREEGWRLPGEGEVRGLHRHELRPDGAGPQAPGGGGEAVGVSAEPGVSAPRTPPEPKPPSGEVLYRLGLPLGLGLVCLAAWHVGIEYARRYDLASRVLPTPWEVVAAIADLAR